jgi:hypothetical protein
MERIIRHLFECIMEQKEEGYGGLCFELDEELDEEDNVDNVVTTLKQILTAYGATNIRYLGDEEEGRMRFHNFKGAFVGNLLCFDFPE